jgi:hypothetical protein
MNPNTVFIEISINKISLPSTVGMKFASVAQAGDLSSEKWT